MFKFLAVLSLALLSVIGCTAPADGGPGGHDYTLGAPGKVSQALSTGLPTPSISSAEWNECHAMTYDSTGHFFDDGSGNHYYLWMQQEGSSSSNAVSWDCAIASAGAPHPGGNIPLITGNVFAFGTRQSDGTILYSGSYYRIKFTVDSGGTPWATAYIP